MQDAQGGSELEPFDDATILFRWKPDRMARLRGLDRLVCFEIHIDGCQVGTLGSGEGSLVVVSSGPHEVFLRVDRLTSDIVELDLQPGEHAELEGSQKRLIQNRFFQFFERKLIYFIIPLALVAYVSKPVVHFIEAHLQYELFAVLSLASLGFLISFPRVFSRKPGAMIALKRLEIEP
jgi:hypothetical protein